MISPGLSNFDVQIINSQINNVLEIEKSNNNFCFFDTSILHAANNTKNKLGSYRLIYLFVTESQYMERYASKKDHSDLYEMYKDYQITNKDNKKWTYQ